MTQKRNKVDHFYNSQWSMAKWFHGCENGSKQIMKHIGNNITDVTVRLQKMSESFFPLKYVMYWGI